MPPGPHQRRARCGAAAAGPGGSVAADCARCAAPRCAALPDAGCRRTLAWRGSCANQTVDSGLSWPSRHEFLADGRGPGRHGLHLHPAAWLAEPSTFSCALPRLAPLTGVALDDLVYICTKLARQMDAQGVDKVGRRGSEAIARLGTGPPQPRGSAPTQLHLVPALLAMACRPLGPWARRAARLSAALAISLPPLLATACRCLRPWTRRARRSRTPSRCCSRR